MVHHQQQHAPQFRPPGIRPQHRPTTQSQPQYARQNNQINYPSANHHNQQRRQHNGHNQNGDSYFLFESTSRFWSGDTLLNFLFTNVPGIIPDLSL